MLADTLLVKLTQLIQTHGNRPIYIEAKPDGIYNTLLANHIECVLQTEKAPNVVPVGETYFLIRSIRPF